MIILIFSRKCNEGSRRQFLMGNDSVEARDRLRVRLTLIAEEHVWSGEHHRPTYGGQSITGPRVNKIGDT